MREKAWILIFLLLIACGSAFLLQSVYNFTGPIIQKNKEVKFKKNVLAVFEVPFTDEAIESTFEEKIKTEKANGKTLYKYFKDGKLQGTAFEYSGMGFQGAIEGILALEPDDKTIKAMKILDQAETPGLGGRIGETEFQRQFKGKIIYPEILIKLKKGNEVLANQVDAITGATETSKSLQSILNKNLKPIKGLLKWQKK